MRISELEFRRIGAHAEIASDHEIGDQMAFVFGGLVRCRAGQQVANSCSERLKGGGVTGCRSAFAIAKIENEMPDLVWPAIIEADRAFEADGRLQGGVAGSEKPRDIVAAAGGPERGSLGPKRERGLHMLGHSLPGGCYRQRNRRHAA